MENNRSVVYPLQHGTQLLSNLSQRRHHALFEYIIQIQNTSYRFSLICPTNLSHDITKNKKWHHLLYSYNFFYITIQYKNINTENNNTIQKHKYRNEYHLSVESTMKWKQFQHNYIVMNRTKHKNFIINSKWWYRMQHL